MDNYSSHKIVYDVCAENNIDIEKFSDSYVLKLSRNERSFFIVGSQFPLNSAVASKIATDKSTASEILSSANIPTVRHKFLTSPTNPPPIKNQLYQKDHETLLKTLHENGDLVVKDNFGSNGKLVFRVRSEKDLWSALTQVFAFSRGAAICQFEEIASEYRVVMLDNQPQLIFEKVINPKSHEWRHNLSRGAKAKIETNEQVKAELIELARQTMDILNLRFASVDIITNSQGEMKILEVNSAVSMHYFSINGSTEYRISKQIYLDAINKMFML